MEFKEIDLSYEDLRVIETSLLHTICYMPEKRYVDVLEKISKISYTEKNKNK